MGSVSQDIGSCVMPAIFFDLPCSRHDAVSSLLIRQPACLGRDPNAVATAIAGASAGTGGGSAHGRRRRVKAAEQVDEVEAGQQEVEPVVSVPFAQRFASTLGLNVEAAGGTVAPTTAAAAADSSAGAGGAGGTGEEEVPSGAANVSGEGYEDYKDYNSSYRVSRPPAFRPQVSLRPGAFCLKAAATLKACALPGHKTHFSGC